MILGKVENQKLTIMHNFVVSDTIDYLTAKFEMSPEWAGRGITAVFTKGETSYAIQLMNGEITADKHLNLSEGVWEVNLYGTDVRGTRITTNPADISVKRTGNMEGTEPGAIPPSIAEQLDARVTALEAGGGGGGAGGVSKEYVDRQDDEMLMDAMEYTDNQLTGYLKTGDISEWAKQPEKPAYTASEVGALPDDTVIPSKTSELQNDSGFLTEHQSLTGYATEEYVNAKVSDVKVPSKLSELTDDAEHRTVTDAEKLKWNGIDVSNPVHTTMNVEVEDDGFGGYRADHSDSEINNHRNAGGLVQAKYSAPGGQTYTYYYSTMESDRKPAFIRTYVENGKTIQVIIKVDNKKKVTVERRETDGGFGYEESAEPTAELKANVFHKFTAPAETVTVTAAPDAGYAEYSFQFTTAGSGGNLSIPAEFAWNGGKVPTLEGNKTYQVVLFSGTAYISGGVPV